jgi:hypothetical protein
VVVGAGGGPASKPACSSGNLIEAGELARRLDGSLVVGQSSDFLPTEETEMDLPVINVEISLPASPITNL